MQVIKQLRQWIGKVDGSLETVAKIYRKETPHYLIQEFKRRRVAILQLGPNEVNDNGRKTVPEYVALDETSMCDIVKVSVLFTRYHNVCDAIFIHDLILTLLDRLCVRKMPRCSWHNIGSAW